MDNKLLTVTEFPVISNQLWRGNDENHVDVLADIYQENTNIAVWKRSLTDKLLEASKSVLSTNPDLEISLIVSPQDTISVLQARLDSSKMVMILIEDILKGKAHWATFNDPFPAWDQIQ